MTKRERVLAALGGEPVDRLPVSAWWHNYRKEWTVEGLAAAMLEIHHGYDWDYLKVYPRHSYCVEDWGVVFRPSGEDAPGVCVDYAVHTPRDWAKLKVLDPEAGVLGDHLRGLRLIRQGLRDGAPMLQTISSPLTVATLLVGNDAERLVQHIRRDPALVHVGLRTIAETVRCYSRACLQHGADGIVFATTDWATQQYLNAHEYTEFGTPYDLHVLDGVQQGATFNLVHICGDNILFDMLSQYPVHALHWGPTLPHNPTLAQARTRTTKALMGGVNERTTLRVGMPADVEAEVREAVRQTRGRHFLLAPGCTIFPGARDENIRALRRAVDVVTV
ncbi:MAG: uroporphyrinogen decarboxylase family protein [Armatimonadota bacterium]